MSNAMLITLLTGGLLCLSLAAYAWHLWRKVWQHRQRLDGFQNEVSGKLAEDLKILCNSLLDGQVPWVEGCIRLKVILEHYDYALSHEEPYAIFQEVFVATEHIPTHDDWKALDKATKRQHESTFSKLEEQFGTRSLNAARQLLQQLGEHAGPPSSPAAASVQSWSPDEQSAKQTLH